MHRDRFRVRLVQGIFGVGICAAAGAAACGFPDVSFDTPDTGSPPTSTLGGGGDPGGSKEGGVAATHPGASGSS
ncbi:MAG TPA: hypothetical protein VH137_02690, partial [Gemmatimonadales bacterium]|nr:hypothetical protein [Gemmatimonadales bacterium]